MTLLRAESIVMRFAGILALDDVSLSVEAGAIVGLIGPNGAGKTTFFNCVSGMVRPTDGRVLLDGRDVTRTSVHRRSHLGMARTFQRMELFGGMTVSEHMLVAERARNASGSLGRDVLGRGRPTADEQARCKTVLSLLGLEADADRPIEALSLGRGRLVELGRALMTEPTLLLLDEPSSGLDVTETEEMGEVLLRIRDERDTAILLVEHDVEMVRRFTERLYVLDFGTLIAEGRTASVMQDPAVQKAYFGDLV